jgi:hypothetical protein
MKLMRAADVPQRQVDRVFRRSPAAAVLAASSVIIAGAVLIGVGLHTGSGLAYYLAAALLLGLVVFRRFVLARFGPSNWLVRMTGEGLFIQLRSHLNHRLAADDQTVVFIAYREIRSARKVREHLEVPYRDLDQPTSEKTSEVRRTLVEFDLAGDCAPLASALSKEYARRPSSGALYKHYPVRLTQPPFLQVEWRVVPGADVFLEALRPHVSVAPPIAERNDYTDLQGLSLDEQKRRLRALVEAGHGIDAVHIARKLFGSDLAQARAFVESLHGSKT